MSTRRGLFEFLAATSLAAIAPVSTTSSFAQTLTDDPLDWELSPDGHFFEERYICFSKGLVHRLDGLPEHKDYANLCKAIQTRELNAVESLRTSLPLINASVPWADPTAGKKINSGQAFSMNSEPWFDSDVMLGDIAELYWAALCRDVPFDAYRDNGIVRQASNELNRIDALRFSTPLFRGALPGGSKGPYLSQFLTKGVPVGNTELLQKIQCPATASNDFLTSLDDWFSCQNGVPVAAATTYLKEPGHIFNGRALAEFVRSDFSFQAYLWAGLILQSWGRDALNAGLAQRYTRNSAALVNSGWPHIFALLAQASEMALQDAWFWKWRAFRRLRPEELAGRRALLPDDAFPRGGFSKIASLEAVTLNKERFGTPLLSQAYPEGAPLHPSFPAGHAEIAGACVTILKAFSDPRFPIPSPMTPSDNGLNVVKSETQLTVEDELNKLAWNMAFGRSFAGIHYRSDNEAGLKLGENIAIKLLADKGREIAGNKSTLWFRRFDGSAISITA